MSLGNPLQSLEPEQLQAVAEWLRMIAQDYDEMGEQPEAVGRCLRSQATQLDILATELNVIDQIQSFHPDSVALPTLLRQSERRQSKQTVRGWIVCRDETQELSYLLMADGKAYRQQLQNSDDESEPQACPIAEMKQAYGSGKFTILAGAEYLADYFTEDDFTENNLTDQC